MNELTITIAKLIGPIYLAVGLGIFFSKEYYLKVYKDLENETLAVFMGGIASLVIGILILINHNIWDSFLASMVTLIGWLALLKGIMLLIFPRTVNRLGDKIAESGIMKFVAFFAMVLGLYISLSVYF